MKHLLPVLCLFCCLVLSQQSALAQPKHRLSLRYNALNYVTPRLADQNLGNAYTDTDGFGLEAEYACRIAPKTFLAFPLKVGKGRVAENSRGAGEDKIIGNVDMLLHYNFLKHNVFLNPSMHFGIGAGWFPEEDVAKDALDVNLPMGLGLNFRLNKRVHLTAQTQYRLAGSSRSGWQHAIGLTQYLGKDKTEDKDKDGVPDLTDRCPDVPGLVAMMGCPDKDGDGIADGDDACPDEKGTLAMAGCPDSDDDGLADNKDKCPREKGPASNNGCPILDRDNDGINDADDACPDAKGPASTRGCPDRDSDGVADKDDACPDKKGDSAHKGCPDTDGDGIYDNDDRCPDRPGTLALRGCPEIKKEDKAKLERAIKLVQFESGKAVLLQKSYAVLDEVMSVMNTYPEYSLNISGHTDSQGDDKMNQALSERRAKACYEYLVKKGVDTNRVSSIGYGESKPIATNMYAAGREQNRRVVFELEVK